MKQREDTIRKWFSLWLDSREAELSDLFTEDAAYIESWGPERWKNRLPYMNTSHWLFGPVGCVVVSVKLPHNLHLHIFSVNLSLHDESPPDGR